MHNNSELRKPPVTDKARIISWTKVPNVDIYSITYQDETTGGTDNIFITKADFDRAFGAIVSGRYSLVKKEFGVTEKEQYDIGRGVTLERDPDTNHCEISYHGTVIGAGAASSQADFENMLKTVKAFAEKCFPDQDDEDEDDGCACYGCPGCPLG